ncbi:MAG: transposase [Akkermansiaceae bacterium]|nr:transposase [Akkermansiaceae bacterium]
MLRSWNLSTPNWIVPIYIYLTNELELPAYLLTIVYKKRWDIEKVFHQLKSKMEERKSWGSSETAKRHHAIFECLAHNLCLLMENEIKRLGLKDEVEEKKAKGREKHRKNREGTLLQKTSQFISQAIIRATQRTVRFIRWLQAALYDPGPIDKP